MSDERKKFQVTIEAHPQDAIETQWGRVRYKQWLLLEAERWQGKWREAWVEEVGKEGLIALFTWAEYQKEISK
jgi:hypothetical protein